jgi:hypothetical protein
MNITKNNFQFVPCVNFQESWDDKKLYKKYKIIEEEINHIESLIKDMQ